MRALADADEMQPVARSDRSLPAARLQVEELLGEALAESAGNIAARHRAEFVAEQEVVAQRRRIRFGVLARKLGGNGAGVAFQRVAPRGAEIDVAEGQAILGS